MFWQVLKYLFTMLTATNEFMLTKFSFIKAKKEMQTPIDHAKRNGILGSFGISECLFMMVCRNYAQTSEVLIAIVKCVKKLSLLKFVLLLTALCLNIESASLWISSTGKVEAKSTATFSTQRNGTVVCLSLSVTKNAIAFAMDINQAIFKPDMYREFNNSEYISIRNTQSGT